MQGETPTLLGAGAAWKKPGARAGAASKKKSGAGVEAAKKLAGSPALLIRYGKCLEQNTPLSIFVYQIKMFILEL